MTVIAPDPVLAYGLSAMPSALPPGPVPFGRKAWDNPVRYKVNRPYGDEFEYASYQQLTRRWTPAGTVPPVSGDFSFPGGSSIEWTPSGTTSSALVFSAPAGDFEAVLEFSIGSPVALGNATSAFPGIGVTDATGVGAAVGLYLYDMRCYSTTTTAGFTTTATNNSVATTVTLDGRHLWISARRTGTLLQARISTDGSTFTALTTGVTVSATAPYLSIAKLYPTSSNTSGVWRLYRLSVYPGPTFFPG